MYTSILSPSLCTLIERERESGEMKGDRLGWQFISWWCCCFGLHFSVTLFNRFLPFLSSSLTFVVSHSSYLFFFLTFPPPLLSLSLSYTHTYFYRNLPLSQRFIVFFSSLSRRSFFFFVRGMGRGGLCLCISLYRSSS